jgi:hypothetical protein
VFYEEVHNRKICSAMQTLQVRVQMVGAGNILRSLFKIREKPGKRKVRRHDYGSY